MTASASPPLATSIPGPSLAQADDDSPEHVLPEPAPQPPDAPPASRLRRSLSTVRELSGVVETLHLPLWTLPATKRSFCIDFSLLSQIDGLSYKCRGQGARIERDVLAPNGDAAVCHVHGRSPWMSTGAFCGLYFCDFEFLPHVVAAVASHRGYGIFVVPKVPLTPPAIGKVQTGPSGAGVVCRYSWYDYLLSHALLTFELPVGAFTSLDGKPVRHPFGVQAVLAQFGQNGRFKSVPRPERRFKLKIIPALLVDGPKLGVRPVLLHRVSHLAEDTSPTLPVDSTPASAPFETNGVEPPRPLESRWAPVLPILKSLANDFPCQGVAGFAIVVATTGLNTYKGSLDKPVLHREPAFDNESELLKRATMMKEVDQKPPRIAGPLPACPWEAARVCPCVTLKKTLTTQSR